MITAPTGSAAFQVGGSTIHAAFLLCDKTKTKASYEKWTVMQLKLEKLMSSITDEISLVGFKHLQQMNETMCTVKGTCDSNWGNICVLAVGDLYQLPHVAQSSVYRTPHTFTTLSDMAPNGWENMQLHELTQIMRQRDMEFAECLNNIHRATPKDNSAEDILLQNCELHVTENDTQYPCDAMHAYAWNESCDE